MPIPARRLRPRRRSESRCRRGRRERSTFATSTGRGEAISFILPDETTLLEDASGQTLDEARLTQPSKPDAPRTRCSLIFTATIWA